MTTPVQGRASTDLRKGALGVGFIVFFVISAAGPLTAVAGGMPIGFLLGNGAGLPSLLLIVIAILLIFSAGYTAMARHVTHAGGFYAFIARGFGGQLLIVIPSRDAVAVVNAWNVFGGRAGNIVGPLVDALLAPPAKGDAGR